MPGPGEAWVVLQLSDKADGVDPDLIRASIRRYLPGATVSIPSTVSQEDSTREHKHVWSGYAFVKHAYPESNYQRLKHTLYVERVLREANGNLALVVDLPLELVAASQEPDGPRLRVGGRVVITTGPYKHIGATVKRLQAKTASVRVDLRSTSRVLTLPQDFLQSEVSCPAL